jgi:hypothetical protein
MLKSSKYTTTVKEQITSLARALRTTTLEVMTQKIPFANQQNSIAESNVKVEAGQELTTLTMPLNALFPCPQSLEMLLRDVGK